MEDVERRIGRRDRVGELAGAVGGIVVDHEDVGLHRLGVDALDQVREIVPLVVGGDDDEDRIHATGNRSCQTSTEKTWTVSVNPSRPKPGSVGKPLRRRRSNWCIIGR
jgi:hypothetical protein